MRRRITHAVRNAAVAAAAFALLAGCARETRPRNIVVVVLDTVRADYATGGGGERSLTPSLARVASGGALFERAWANAPWTVPSHASMFTGLMPSEHGCTGKSPRFDSAAPTLAEILSGAGYETIAFYSNPWLTDNMTGILRGFEQQVVAGPPDMRLLNLLKSRAQGGPETVSNVERWLARRDPGRPFFVFVNFLEAHLPYAPPPDYRGLRPSSLPLDDEVSASWAHEFNAGLHGSDTVDWDRVRYLYAGDVYASDMLLGRLLDLLERSGLADDTAVIVTSDHGENLGDHALLDHQFGVFETLLSVPLIVRAPGRVEPGVRSDPAMLTDVYATVLDLAGAESDEPRPHSRSLAGEPAPPDRPVLAEYAGANEPLLKELEGLNPDFDRRTRSSAFGTVRVRDLRLTVGSDGSLTLHDLSRDPGQLRNLAAERPADAEALRLLLPAFSTGLGATPDVDERMREWLRALGYVI